MFGCCTYEFSNVRVNMIEKVHFEWLLLKKQPIFVSELNIIFDISRAAALVKKRNLGEKKAVILLDDQRPN